MFNFIRPRRSQKELEQAESRLTAATCLEPGKTTEAAMTWLQSSSKYTVTSPLSGIVSAEM
jgi:hypothetical protein